MLLPMPKYTTEAGLVGYQMGINNADERMLGTDVFGSY